MSQPRTAGIADESVLMRACRAVGLEGIAWSLRRLYIPVPRSAIVLEVGSGGNPYYRANVLLDAYLDSRERHFVPLVHDRPTVLGFVERLPFCDDSFDFVIASHVLEHSADPDRFLQELQRVARAGYIEVPDAFTERLTSYLDHRVEVTERDGELRIRKKQAYATDPELDELFRHRVSKILPELMGRHPFAFHVRYYWTRENGEGIRYVITNPEVDCAWTAVSEGYVRGGDTIGARMKRLGLSAARRLLSQHRRNRLLDVMRLLCCPCCGSSELKRTSIDVSCLGCARQYAVIAGDVIDFTKPLA